MRVKSTTNVYSSVEVFFNGFVYEERSVGAMCYVLCAIP